MPKLLNEHTQKKEFSLNKICIKRVIFITPRQVGHTAHWKTKKCTNIFTVFDPRTVKLQTERPCVTCRFLRERRC